MTTPPPFSAEPSHWCTEETGATDDTAVVVVQVPVPARIAAAVPTHRVMVTVEAGEGDSAPVAVT
ncbi:MAG: hypothetical protein WC273_01465 [Dehalococcoidia bacterium]